MNNFIGREREISQLKEAVHSKKSTITIIYGRRRVGKSALIKKALEGCPVTFFEGLENQSKAHQILNFLSQLSFQTKKSFDKELPKTWREALMELLDLCREPGAVFVFD